MLITLFLLTFSTVAFDASYVENKFTKNILADISFEKAKSTFKITHAEQMVAMLSSQILCKSKSKKYKDWYRDSYIKLSLINTIEIIVHNIPEITYPHLCLIWLDKENREDLSARSHFEAKIKNIKKLISQAINQDRVWFNQHPYICDETHKNIYYQFLIWGMLKRHAYADKLISSYANKAQELLHTLPIQLHDIPSIRSYLDHGTFFEIITPKIENQNSSINNQIVSKITESLEKNLTLQDILNSTLYDNFTEETDYHS